MLPKVMREALGVQDGDALLATLEDGRVVLARPEQFARATRGSIKGAWGSTKQAADRFLERERESWR